MQKWEYLEVTLDGSGQGWFWSDTEENAKKSPASEHLSKIGAQGWELVSVSEQVERGTTRFFYYTFKRPLES